MKGEKVSCISQTSRNWCQVRAAVSNLRISKRSSKNESFSLSLLAWNTFYNLETIHLGAYPEVLEELKQNTVYNNVPKTNLSGLLLVMKRHIPFTQLKGQESKDLFVARVIVYRFQQWELEANQWLKTQKKNWRGSIRFEWNDGRLGIEEFNEEKMGEYFQHHLLFILLSFLCTPPSYFIKVLALPRETSHL